MYTCHGFAITWNISKRCYQVKQFKALLTSQTSQHSLWAEECCGSLLCARIWRDLFCLGFQCFLSVVALALALPSGDDGLDGGRLIIKPRLIIRVRWLWLRWLTWLRWPSSSLGSLLLAASGNCGTVNCTGKLLGIVGHLSRNGRHNCTAVLMCSSSAGWESESLSAPFKKSRVTRKVCFLEVENTALDSLAEQMCCRNATKSAKGAGSTIDQQLKGFTRVIE